MKVIFMGTPDFAVPTLKKLIESEHEIVGVFTQKPKAAARGLKIIKSAVHELAEKHHLDVFTPESLKIPIEQEKFKNLQADIAVVVAYGMLLPKEILEAPKHGCINLHPSLLPRWRGAAPLQRTIMTGDRHTAVCVMKMDEGLDTGDVILKEEFDIPPTADLGWLHDKCAELGAELVLKTLYTIENLKPKYTKQSEHGVVYAKKITKQDELINFHDSGEDIINKIRALSPYPGAYFILDGVKYKLFEAEFATTSALMSELDSGVIINNEFHIDCSDGVIIPKIIQKEGKARMKIEDFLRGNKITPGEVANKN